MNTRVSEEYWVIREVALSLNKEISKLAHSGKIDQALNLAEAKNLVLEMLENGSTIDEVLEIINSFKVIN